ncbi:MAG TPA: SsrA-binding protein SmpB [Rickettsiales bacterium]|nr:SsrA-binding protein SmpB [Rickettsiales bacterium]
MKIIAQNKKARHEYEILNEYDAGIALVGSEIKSLRAGKANIQEGFIEVDKNGEVYISNMSIPIYSMSSNYFNHKPTRKRKLLLNKKEINKIAGSVKLKGTTVIPLMLYINDKNFAKLKIGIGKGKKLYDKRQDIKERDWQRDKSRIMKEVCKNRD